MLIKIAARLRPFSHTPGARCVVPRTCSIIEAFPTLLRLDGQEWKMALTGPIDGFTLQQDLERDCLFVFGKAREGYFRLRIEAQEDGFQIHSEKGPLKGGKLAAPIRYAPQTGWERLSLGSHRAQDWDLLQRRKDLKEILPLLFSLGQKTPWIAPQPLLGTARLLELPSARAQLDSALLKLIQAAFKSFLIPRLIDDAYQGLSLNEAIEGDPFFLLQEGAKRVRSLFFSQNERRIAFLPHLPLSLDAGRFMGARALGIGTIDFEWSKKILRRVLLRADTSGEILLELQKEIQSLRVGKKKRQLAKEPLFIEAGKTYHLDRFEK